MISRLFMFFFFSLILPYILNEYSSLFLFFVTPHALCLACLLLHIREDGGETVTITFSLPSILPFYTYTIESHELLLVVTNDLAIKQRPIRCIQMDVRLCLVSVYGNLPYLHKYVCFYYEATKRSRGIAYFFCRLYTAGAPT